MTKANSKRNLASPASDRKTKTRNSVRRTTAHKSGQLKPAIKPAVNSDRGPRRSRAHAAQAKRLSSLQCCERQLVRPSRRWHVQRSGNRIRSAASSPVSCARSSASLLSRQTARMGASTGLRIARRQQRRSAMRQTRPVSKKSNQPDSHWTTRSRICAISISMACDCDGRACSGNSRLLICLAICCLPFSPTGSRPTRWAISIPLLLDC